MISYQFRTLDNIREHFLSFERPTQIICPSSVLSQKNPEIYYKSGQHDWTQQPNGFTEPEDRELSAHSMFPLGTLSTSTHWTCNDLFYLKKLQDPFLDYVAINYK